MKPILAPLTDSTDPRALAGRLRQARFSLFQRLVTRLATAGEIAVLDIGGAPDYWLRLAGFDQLPVQVTLLNLIPYAPPDHPRLHVAVGDARALPQYADVAFDLVHSNSVIEHVGPWEDQQRVAAEIHRLGRAYFVQTPNRYFPMEPHFLLPGFQFLPPSLKGAIAARWRPGWYRDRPVAVAAAEARAIRLLTRGELRRLFPDAFLWSERFLGLTKSFVAYHDPSDTPL